MIEILNCSESDCPKDFNELAVSGETYIRTCMTCWKRVVLALDKNHADSYLETGDKVALETVDNIS
tara:strand:- start:313 stop:510 length:198 start_codon:yes stop_codon:yes gene_type:complete